MFRGFFAKTLSFVGYTVQYGCIAHCAFEYIGELVSCSGPSMEPTIISHDVVFSERISRHLCRIQKGDVIIAKSPFDPKMNICKRVIGLEGDKVCTSGPSDIFKTHSYVPRGHIWLEGDNLRNSTDSRSYGPIPYALIRGRVCFKVMRKKSSCLIYMLPLKPNNKLLMFALLCIDCFAYNIEIEWSFLNVPL
ncbi:mitochondrial inner membrane protease subunit 1-like isoform X1 [Xyrauchen texanus]|uniref:mitochondrial inner membrane protease subunit 1-like isoform X1 n=1 Tax=Xyrauchen texanus TaxID=154827 RepID=UPI0022426AC2|nr:mitochondrial inner membrane protease subunit 1-like isoform X1 [Xyrauchen texanus]